MFMEIKFQNLLTFIISKIINKKNLNKLKTKDNYQVRLNIPFDNFFWIKLNIYLV
jgi:hypothetical protein